MAERLPKDGPTLIHFQDYKSDYPQICFNYIHQNPVKANLVRQAENWEFSSAPDYSELRNGSLVNKIKAREFVEF